MVLVTVKFALNSVVAEFKYLVKYSFDSLVKNLFIKRTVFNGFNNFLVISSVTCGHFEVKPCFNAFNSLIHCSPVGHYIALEAPVAAENICEKPFILRCESAVNLVVGAHEGVWLSFFYCGFECREIDLT